MSDFRVFAQSADTPIDIVAWNAHAVRFFATKLGFAELAAPRWPGAEGSRGGAAAPPPPQANPPPQPNPLHSMAGSATTLRTRFVIAPPGAPPGIRSATRRPCDVGDFAEAETAEAASGTTGLARLARRCGALWIIEREGAQDALALRFAAILASLVLGPILDPDAKALFGVRTAREKMSAAG